jgi:aspartate/methionine/tyrosine aminotransferase
VFSSRLPRELPPNELARAVADLRAAGTSLIDLTATNPTAVGIPYPTGVLSSLTDPLAERYVPDPQGLPAARQAVSAEFARQGARIAPDRIVLTASTSEAYALLFKLLCDAGDDVLIPQPSYPLFEWLTRLDNVTARPYRLDFHGRWSIDRHDLEGALTPRTRAVLVVSPNNPTGARLHDDDRDWLVDLCAARDLALIADEVFADYPLADAVAAAPIAGESRVLTFSLGGLSKSAGLPQVKLGWMGISGPDAHVAGAVERLSVIGDTYLSVSTPVQVAAAQLIAAGREVRAVIQGRLERNLGVLRSAIAGHPSIALLEPEAGWSAVLRVPAVQSEEALVLRLLRDAHVLVHPGYFFDFAHEAFVVVSLLPEPAALEEGVARLVTIASRP